MDGIEASATTQPEASGQTGDKSETSSSAVTSGPVRQAVGGPSLPFLALICPVQERKRIVNAIVLFPALKELTPNLFFHRVPYLYLDKKVSGREQETGQKDTLPAHVIYLAMDIFILYQATNLSI